jgi:hypothetical protein
VPDALSVKDGVCEDVALGDADSDWLSVADVDGNCVEVATCVSVPDVLALGACDGVHVALGDPDAVPEEDGVCVSVGEAVFEPVRLGVALGVDCCVTEGVRVELSDAAREGVCDAVGPCVPLGVVVVVSLAVGLPLGVAAWLVVAV